MDKLQARLRSRTVLIGLIALTAIFFASTNPAKLPPIALMVGFGLFALTVYCIVGILLHASGVAGRLKPRQYSLVHFSFTALPVLLMALQSLGQLTLRDGVTLLLLLSIGYFYISRSTA